MTTFTPLGAMLAYGMIMFGAVESAIAAPDKPRHSAIRDHRGTGGAPSGGIKVDGRRVDIKPITPCYGGVCPRQSGRGPAVRRDHR
jgi:hypothetical protein